MIFMSQRDGQCSSFSSNEGTVFEGSNVYGFLSDYTTSLFLLSRSLQCKRILGRRNLVRVRIAVTQQGARDFSCAVSGFGQAEDVSACGRGNSSSHARKNLWYPGYIAVAAIFDFMTVEDWGE